MPRRRPPVLGLARPVDGRVTAFQSPRNGSQGSATASAAVTLCAREHDRHDDMTVSADRARARPADVPEPEAGGLLTLIRGGTAARHDDRQPSLDGAPQFRQLLDALGVAVYTTDADGRITFYNEAAAALWGRRPAPGEEWCGSWRLYWPDGRRMAHDECPMAICLREQRPVRGQEAMAERPDGTHVWFQPHPTPLRDDEGRVVGAVNVLVDVSERRHAEDALRATAAALAASSAVKDEFLG